MAVVSLAQGNRTRNRSSLLNTALPETQRVMLYLKFTGLRLGD